MSQVITKGKIKSSTSKTGQSGIPVEQLHTTEKLELIKTASLKHPFYLGKYVLGYSEMENIHYDLLSFIVEQILTKKSHCLDLEPRGCFKTTCISVTLPIWLELKWPDIKILINHKVSQISKSILEEIQAHYKSNKLFIGLFGDRIGDIWRSGFIISKFRTQPAKEATISAGSVDKELVAGHFNVVIDDDIVTLKDYLSRVEREKTKAFHTSVRYLAEDGTLVDVGTRWHTQDLWSEIIPSLSEKSIRIKSIEDEDGNLYFPNKYSREKLIELRGTDPISNLLYDAVMMQKPRNDSADKPFTELLFINDENNINMSSMSSLLYLDLAFSQTKTSCYFAGACIQTFNNGQDILCKDFIYRKISADKAIDLLPGFIAKNKVGMILYESNSAQRLYESNLKTMIKEKDLRISIRGIENTTNKHMRIMSAQPTIVTKVYFLESKIKDAYSDYANAVVEIKNYSKDAEYKDATDSLAGAITHISNIPKVGVL